MNNQSSRASKSAHVAPASGVHVEEPVSLAVEATLAGLGAREPDCSVSRPSKPRVTCSIRVGRATVPGLELSSGAGVAIRRYARFNPWLEPQDLAQEAALVALEARTTSSELWEARLVGLALSRFVAEAKAPVSLPKRKGESWQEAAGTHRAPLMCCSGAAKTSPSAEFENPAVAAVAAEQFEPLEEVLDRERACAEIRRLLAEECEAARAVLLDGEKPAEVAQRLGWHVRDVYEQTAQVVRYLRAALTNLGLVPQPVEA